MKKIAIIGSGSWGVALANQLDFFENKENAREFGERNIVSADRQVVLPGAGINLEKYKMDPYTNHSRVQIQYHRRIMIEKGKEEHSAVKKKKKKQKQKTNKIL